MDLVQQYADTLSPEAMRAFVDTTHERYAVVVGGHLGSVIPVVSEPSTLRWSRSVAAGNKADYA